MEKALHIHELERTIDETVPSVKTVTFPTIKEDDDGYNKTLIAVLNITLVVLSKQDKLCLTLTANSSGSVVVEVEEAYHSLPEKDKEHLADLVGQYILIGERDSK